MGAQHYFLWFFKTTTNVLLNDRQAYIKYLTTSALRNVHCILDWKFKFRLINNQIRKQRKQILDNTHATQQSNFDKANNDKHGHHRVIKQLLSNN